MNNLFFKTSVPSLRNLSSYLKVSSVSSVCFSSFSKMSKQHDNSVDGKIYKEQNSSSGSKNQSNSKSRKRKQQQKFQKPRQQACEQAQQEASNYNASYPQLLNQTEIKQLEALHRKSQAPESIYPNFDRTKDNTAKSSTSPRKNHKRPGLVNKLPELKFEEYISLEECSSGLKKGTLIKGTIRINQKDFNEAFISNPVDNERDIFLEGLVARNRALPDDVVAVELLPEDQWKTMSRLTNKLLKQDELQKQADGSVLGPSGESTYVVKLGKVVYLIEQKHSRAATGFLKVFKNNAFGFALFSPTDNRLPRLMIPQNECPKDFFKRPQDFEKMLFVAHISNWNLNMAFASGKLMQSLGEAGHIEPETEAILVNNHIDSQPFPDDVLACLPDGATWKITDEELSKRRDLRNECIFTVDPATARDLDDALSCEKIGDDLYQVGVHIADVSYFIEQGNALDKMAASRATSVYLAQKVIPMLPSVLCEQLCSLNPGVERLAYSVMWKLRGDGTILEEWFGRSVIKSCIKLSYDHAQQFIESDDGFKHDKDEFPEIFGNFSLSKISLTTKMLFNISKHLRKRRFDSGALRLDQPKLSFHLNSETGLPNACFVYDYKDSNRMIEEFMLLANIAVARKIYNHHPDRAILRRHPPPNPKMMDDLDNLCQQHGIEFDITSSSTISKSLSKILELEDETKETLLPAVTMMCTKPFQQALYFCSGTIGDEYTFRHYALNVPLYTHFTSPIRRYPDVLVHRFLTSALDKQFKVVGKPEDLQIIAENCNDKKINAKKASDQSAELFLNSYVAECGPVVEEGVVVGVFDKAVDILCVRLGVVKRVYCDKLSLYGQKIEEKEVFKQTLTLYWKKEESFESLDVDERLKQVTAKLEKKWELEKQLAEPSNENIEIPADAKTQVLSLFSPVKIHLSVSKSSPNKMTALLQSPFNENDINM